MSPRRKDRFQTMEEFTCALPALTADTKVDVSKRESQVSSEETTIIVQESAGNEVGKQEDKQDNTKVNGFIRPVVTVFVVLFLFIGGMIILGLVC